MSPMLLSSDDLDRLHEVQLEMLLEVDRICRHLGVAYQLGAGSLLGAVRHGGFIPWDSDIDVVMLRTAYRRFLREAPPLLDSRFFLQTWRSDPRFPACFAKVRRHNSVFRLAGGERTQHHQGIYLDIFPFDPVRPESWWWRVQLAMVRFLRRSAGRLQNPHDEDGDPLAPGPPAGSPAWRQLLHPILHPGLIPLPPQWKTAVQEGLLRSLVLSEWLAQLGKDTDLGATGNRVRTDDDTALRGTTVSCNNPLSPGALPPIRRLHAPAASGAASGQRGGVSTAGRWKHST
jgi:hypothetical protein